MSGMYIVYMNMCVILNAVLAGGKRRRRQEGKRVEEGAGRGRIKGEREEERYLCVCTKTIYMYCTSGFTGNLYIIQK